MNRTIICPKCSHVRPKDATNPEWQCPACGVCYAKAGDTSAGAPTPARVRHEEVVVKQGWDLGTLFKIILFVVLGWAATQIYQSKRGIKIEFTQGEAMAQSEGPVDARLRQAAVGARRSDLILYSAEWCGYCNAAKAMFAENNIPYTNCDAEKDMRCAREYADLHGGGYPLFVVRGKRLQEGLDYEALIAALEKH
ncbi:glutaredoxin family protein [Pseudoduganella violaceinigra]|uniref:glutaredoxin family protein n=1 Tax=Pseudoduganella violaceinigra TaxID=246602 RepID=UPI000414DE15|nr:glutaredoxin domain-containing protein [Pseudoduganella violaceinigra]